MVLEVYLAQLQSGKVMCYGSPRAAIQVALIDLVPVTVKRLFHPIQLFRSC